MGLTPAFSTLAVCSRIFHSCIFQPCNYARAAFSTPAFSVAPLKVPERIQFRLCVLVHRCLHGNAPPYLAETLRLTSDVESRRRLRSGSTSTLLVPSTRRATPVVAARAWNALPLSVRTSSTYLAFRRQLKTLLFKASFEDWT